MAGAVDYARLRDSTLNSAQEEEAVTVNTRALIDKVLARYSGEWTTLRELIQNAADASATKVSIKFETLASPTVPAPQTTDAAAILKHTVLHHTLRRLLVSNNGQAFAESDWSRLKRIAEGNPDETKIGAFGVGFYSVFAECESPFVTSGNQTMAFYWKGNSLFTRRGKLPVDVQNSDTCFVLDYRNSTTTVPNLMSICQFLSTSLTFVGLESIELWLDDRNVFTLTKKSAPSTAVAIPKDIVTKTSEGTMRINSVDCQNAQIDAQWMNIVGWVPKAVTSSQTDVGNNDAPSLRSFFSRFTGSAQSSAAAKKAAKEEELAQQAIAEDLTGLSRATVFTRINTVHIKTQVSTTFAQELERATKKPPPKSTRIAILTSSYDETAASLSTLTGAASKKVAEIITSVLPTKAGRVFIGFPTAQTTGLLAHISAPSLIPTVERESIDLNARYVRTWNTELLSVAGIACRIAYAGEMASIRDKLSALRAAKGKLEDSDVAKVLPAAVHALKQYTFRDATPLAKAGEIIQQSFWTCNKSHSIEILSSRGVLPSHEVRIASEDLSFVKGVPVVPEALITDARDFMRTIQDFGLISDITTDDIKTELEKQAISEDQLHEFLKWSAKKIRCNELDSSAIHSLFLVTVVNTTATGEKSETTKLLILGEMKAYVNSARISPDLPVPPDTVPFRFTKGLQQADLQAFGWRELQLEPWVRWLLLPFTRRTLGSDLDMTASATFSGAVLATLSKAWDTSLSQSSRSTLAELLSQETVIPTKLGMRKPADCYFPSVKLFDDLPTTAGLNAVKEKFLKALGVRKTIELQVIFARLMAKSNTKAADGKTGWSHVDLVRYLVSVWTDIPEQDIVQLRNTALCPAELDGDHNRVTTEHYKLSQLFEPKDSLRGLGVPLLQWPGTWNSYSSEGKFLRNLGLRPYPSAPELVEIMSRASKAQNTKLYEAAMQYFLENHYQNNYAAFDLSDVQVSFVPALDGDKPVVVKPEECFTDKKAAVLGYKIMRENLHSHAMKLGVRTNPPIQDCAVRLMRKPPQSQRDARELFTYFAGRLNDLTPEIVSHLSNATIVPIQTLAGGAGATGDSKYRHAMPSACFLGDGEEYGEIFDYVDFGLEPNSFLLRIGSKHEPSTVELTGHLIREPARIYQILRTEKYLGLLRKLHLNMATLKRDKNLWRDMKKAPFLLCFKLVPAPDSTSKSASLLDDDDEMGDEKESRIRQYRLRAAEGCIVNDDYQVYRLFRDHIAAAPEDEAIEELYSALGCPALSQLVQMEPRLGPLIMDQSEAERLRELILERSRLFLHEQSTHGIRHDIKWLEKHLQVQIVQSVSLRRTLRLQNVSHTEKRSAALSKATLSVTSRPDLWQVSQEIVSLLIDRPKPQTIMVLETFMTTSLYKLRARGYNVDRILRRKAAEEARNAEIERQRKEEEQKKHTQELERQMAMAPAANQIASESTPYTDDPQSPRDRQITMPGAFEDSPDRHVTNEQTAQPKPRGLFSSLTRRLGLDDPDSSASTQLQKLLGQNNPQQQMGQTGQAGHDVPPPYTPQATRPHAPAGHTNGTVTAPGNIQQNLQSAINSSRAHNSTSLFSRPETNEVKEVSSYCDSRPGQNLTLVSQSSPGLPVYVGNSSMDPTTFIARNASGVDSFASLLLDCGSIFSLRKDTLHVFYDEQGNSIAFNSGGSLFCNYRYFAQLHQATIGTIEGRSRALVYWFVVLCHELAHNLVSDHGSNHSFYAEQFVAEYFPAAMGVLAKYSQQMYGQGQIEGRGQNMNGVERAFS